MARMLKQPSRRCSINSRRRTRLRTRADKVRYLSLFLLLLLLLVLFWFLLSSILLSRSCSINSRRGQTRWDDCPCCYVGCCYLSCCLVWFAQPKGYQREDIKPKKNLPRLSRIFRLIFLSLFLSLCMKTGSLFRYPGPLRVQAGGVRGRGTGGRGHRDQQPSARRQPPQDTGLCRQHQVHVTLLLPAVSVERRILTKVQIYND